jgi:hypothetical protein
MTHRQRSAPGRRTTATVRPRSWQLLPPSPRLIGAERANPQLGCNRVTRIGKARPFVRAALKFWARRNHGVIGGPRAMRFAGNNVREEMQRSRVVGSDAGLWT